MTEAAPIEVVIRERRGSRRAFTWFVTLLVALVALVAAAGIGVRFFVMSGPGRQMIEAQTSGLKLGPVGRLRIEGLNGDVLTDFTIRKLTIFDEHGVWLEGRNVHVQWDYWQLFHRLFAAKLVAADDVEIYRRPTLTPKEPDHGLPVSFDIKKLTTRLDTDPAATIERGQFNVDGVLKVARNGAGSGHLEAKSLLHAGDGVTADFAYGKGNTLQVAADVIEAQGGAIAGALGLPSKKPFSLRARIGGATQDGQIDVVAHSGETTPLEAKGGWNKNGLRAQGHVDLTASTLTAGQVKRFGPSMTFTASGDQTAKDGVYSVRLQGQAENLDLVASGPVRISDRSTPGLAVDFKVQDMSRLETVVVLGPSEFHGKLTGKPGDFKFSGNVVGQHLALWGYSLAQAQGTAEVGWAKRELDIKADLTGSGGEGTGMFPGLMGASPHATTEIVRLADGRLLIRSIDGQTSAFTLHGQGTRTPIVGTLNFDGHARLTNLSPIYAGTKGVVEGEWTASQGQGTSWNFTANAQGSQFATGVEQVDRLVGVTPKLEGRAEFDHGVWLITRSTLNGKAGNARSTGTYTPQTNALDLKVNWDAKGPFDAGPLEIAGNIAGDGVVKGTLNLPRAELSAVVPGIDIGRLTLNNAKVDVTIARGVDDSSGTIAVTAQSANGPATGHAAFRFPLGGVDLTGIDASAGGLTARGSLALRDGEPSRADLTMTAGPGAYLAAGQAQGRVTIVDAPGGAQANLTVTASDVQLPDTSFVFHSATLSANGPLARLPYTLKADVRQGDTPITLDGTGLATQAKAPGDGSWNVSFAGQGHVDKIAVATLEPLTVNFGGPALTAQANLSVGGGRAVVSARQEGEDVSASAKLTGVEISVLSPDLAGRFDAQLTASGKGANLGGQLDATLQSMRSRDGPTESAINGTLKATLAAGRVALNVQATNQAGLMSTATATLPAVATASPFRIAIDRTKPIDGAFDVDGELQPIWDLFYGGTRTLGGRLQARGTLAGTINNPQIAGQANLTDGHFEDFASGLKLRNVTMSADLQRNAVTVSAFNAQDTGQGTLGGQGVVSLVSGGESTFKIQAQKFLLIDNDLAKAQASGNLTVTRAADGKATLTGKLVIDQAHITAAPPVPSGVVPMDVVEINVPPGRANNFEAPTTRGPAVTLDVTLTAPSKVYVNGRGLDVELQLDSHVGGTSTRPILTGQAKVVRGAYDFSGKRFEFDDTGIVYLGSTADTIRLDLSATREDPNLTAVVKIKGTAAKPDITLTSTPLLPNDEILSQVLFGHSAAQLSPVEAAQLASSLAALATGGGFDVIGGLRQFVRLDRLAFGGGDAASGLTVSGGKYVTDNVYLELTGGGREGSSAEVEWRVRRNLSIVSSVAGTGDTRLSVRWRQDYGKKPSPAASGK